MNTNTPYFVGAMLQVLGVRIAPCSAWNHERKEPIRGSGKRASIVSNCQAHGRKGNWQPLRMGIWYSRGDTG
jgi:hypothetical protein